MSGRGLKRTASKRGTPDPVAPAQSKKKKTVIKLDIPTKLTRRCGVMTTGQGDVGQLGHGPNVGELTKFKWVKALGNNIVDAIAGGMHTIALDKDGKVWTFGCNDEGALGRVTTGEDDESKVVSVNLPRPAVRISAGDSHSAAILDNGDLYAWGAFRDSKGSMGLVLQGREGKATKAPVHIDVGEPVAAIASGSDHLVILTTSHSIFTMGCGEQGQLGRVSPRAASRESRAGLEPLLIPSTVNMRNGASRVWAGSHSTIALDSMGDKMFACGLNNFGQLGIRMSRFKSGMVLAPYECDAFHVSHGWKEVSCGMHHTLAIDHKGQVYVIGRCEYGRLGLGKERKTDAETLEPIESLTNCVSVSAGGCNSLAVNEAGEAFSWGIGSEGLLGSGKTDDEESPVRCVLIPWPESTMKVVKGSAGGQHTLLLVETQNNDENSIDAGEPQPSTSTASVPPADVPNAAATAGPSTSAAVAGTSAAKTAPATIDEDEEEVSSTSAVPDAAAPKKDQEQAPEKKDDDNTMEVDETGDAGPSKVEATKEADNEAEAQPAVERALTPKTPDSLPASDSIKSLESVESVDEDVEMTPQTPSPEPQQRSNQPEDIDYPLAQDIPNMIVNNIPYGLDDLLSNSSADTPKPETPEPERESSQERDEDNTSQDTDKSEELNIPVAIEAPVFPENVNGNPELIGQPAQPDARRLVDAAPARD